MKWRIEITECKIQTEFSSRRPLHIHLNFTHLLLERVYINKHRIKIEIKEDQVFIHSKTSAPYQTVDELMLNLAGIAVSLVLILWRSAFGETTRLQKMLSWFILLLRDRATHKAYLSASFWRNIGKSVCYFSVMCTNQPYYWIKCRRLRIQLR